MTIELAAPSWLWALGVVPAILLAIRVGRSRSSSGSPAILAAIRSAIVVAVVLALAEPVLSHVSTRSVMVFLVDVSHSASSRALESIAQEIDDMTSAVGPDDIRILGFGGHVATIDDTAALRRLAVPAAASALDDEVVATRTNLEQALAAARAEIPAGSDGRIVMFSDGRATDGDALRAAERLAAEGVVVFTDVMPVRDIGDVWVQAIRWPRTPVVDAVSTVDVVIGSQAEQNVRVSVREGERTLGSKTAVVVAGETIVSVDAKLSTIGAHVVTAEVSAERDGVATNNALSAEAVVEPRPRVLYVHTDAERASIAPLALRQAGIDVTLAHPRALPSSSAALDRFDVVALSNVGRALVSQPAMAAIADWVEERGGGLLFVGGNAVVGEGPTPAQAGYRGTEIERLLPVTFDREDEPDVALVIVLDRSWSMNGLPMDLSKVAAEGAARTLDGRQLVGILTFNNENTWAVPLARVRDSQATLHESILGITPSGPTAIYPALAQAFAQLVGVRARAKHIILLSDGQTAPADFEGLAKDMSAAHITVSSVAFGPEADATLLRNVATWGGGRSYAVLDARQIPEIFVKEAKNAATPGTEDNASITASARRAQGFVEATGGMPPLSGRNVVTKKEEAIELLATPRGDPLLTYWPVGLGRAAMFAADLDGYWTKGWLGWRGFGGFLATMTRSLAPRHLPQRALTVAGGDRQGTGRVVTVTLEARTADGHAENVAAPTVEVRSTRGETATLRLSQTGPGRYQATMAADTTAPLTFSVAGGANAPGSTRIFVDDDQAEYRFAEPDVAMLTAIAARTGGAFQATPDIVAKAPLGGTTSRTPLAPWLLGVALLAWFGDIVARRLRPR